MTNRERAEILVEKCYPRGRDAQVNYITLALDEAEKRGASRCAVVNQIGIDRLTETAKKIGFVEGQKEMRERAAKVQEKRDCGIDDCTCLSAESIRSLPIDGEK